jgi:hypothetical protein
MAGKNSDATTDGLPSSESPLEIPAASVAVLATLVYYHLFRFPLTLDEVHRLSGQSGGPEVTQAALDWLEAHGVAGHENGHVFLGDASQVEERKVASSRAEAAESRIASRARLIGRFPFVRGVGLSGSASKGVMRPGDDLDFFVVTAPGRLWVCRTLLMMFKKIFLLNSHRFFCVNYLVSEDGMELPDRNVFTAMEIAWLRPLWGSGWYERFLRANDWTGQFLPNWTPVAAPGTTPAMGWIKRGLERLGSGALGDRADEWLRLRILERNRRRYEKRFAPGEFDIAFRSERHASKHHPGHHQGRVSKRYEAALETWRAKLPPSRVATGEPTAAGAARS